MAGSATFSMQNITGDKKARRLTINWTGDASTGQVSAISSDAVTVPAHFAMGRTISGATCTLTEALIGFYPLAVKATPLSPSPTIYGSTWLDADALDWLLGKIVSMSATLPSAVNIQSITPGMPIDRALSFTLTQGGSPVASATGKLEIYLIYAGLVP